MNLIEQLGGYGEAKGLFNLYEYSISFRYYKDFEGDFESAGYVDVFIPDLQKALLEYRRQHNIFEVGDKVVSIDKYSNDMIFTITELTSKNVFTSMEFGEIAYSFVRHAKAEEIKAGRRL